MTIVSTTVFIIFKKITMLSGTIFIVFERKIIESGSHFSKLNLFMTSFIKQETMTTL